MSYLGKVLFFLTLFLELLASAVTAQQHTDDCLIYGRITTIDNSSYQGVIRWGREEAFWSDFFNSQKESNPYLKYLSNQQKRNLDPSQSRANRRHRWVELSSGFSGISHIHSFSCRFGDIKSVEILGRSTVNVEVKNQRFINLRGGSNDLGTKVWIKDQDVGMLKLNWDQIKQIDFLKTPESVEQKFGDPLYGVVQTRQGKFEGFIQWDHDERLTSDKLDGVCRHGDVSIRFDKLVSIEKEGFGCNVVFRSGRELFLENSNDVDQGNRGVIITMPGIGRVNIRWKDFEMVEFFDPKDVALPGYDEFPSAKRISGTVLTKDNVQFKGIIAYDLDEAMDVEMLNGLNDNLEYFIPFRNVSSISPRNYNYSLVELKNGKKILLGEQRDVAEGNAGVLVFSESENPKYIPWRHIQKVTFD